MSENRHHLNWIDWLTLLILVGLVVGSIVTIMYSVTPAK